MSLWGQIAQREHLLSESRKHAHALEAELRQLRAAAQHVDHSQPIPRGGVDYAFEPHPSTSQLRAAHVTFACRYLTGVGKALSKPEAENLSGAGIDVVAIFEQGGRELQGYDAGARMAHMAAAAAKRLGMPGDRPIYFTCDFDAAGERKVSEVLEAVRGAVHAIGWTRVGLYAGLDVINAAHAVNRCKFYWQTLAWSRGVWSPHAQLRQVQVNRRIGGADCDIDKAVAHDFGQWRV